MTIEELLETPCYVADFLPQQVPADNTLPWKNTIVRRSEWPPSSRGTSTWC